MNAIASRWAKLWASITAALKNNFLLEQVVLLLTRIGLGMIFLKSYWTRIEEGTWFVPNEFQSIVFAEEFRNQQHNWLGLEFSGIPIADSVLIPMTIFAEFALPMLIFAGLFSRFTAVGFAIMALAIQIFIYPEAVHFFGFVAGVLALAAITITRGPGIFSLDWVLGKVLGRASGLSAEPAAQLKVARAGSRDGR